MNVVSYRDTNSRLVGLREDGARMVGYPSRSRAQKALWRYQGYTLVETVKHALLIIAQGSKLCSAAEAVRQMK